MKVLKLYRDGRIAVRLLVDEDATLLARWLSDPRVLQFYEGRDRPHDLDLVRQHYYDRTQPLTACIIEYDNQAIGYIQFYEIMDQERQEYGLIDFKGKVFGMDQFIGEVDYWNRGIGTELIRSMVRYLYSQQQADKIVMDPQTWNERALHVYEKCGFIKKRLLPKHEWHEGVYRDCWLIEHDGSER